MTYANYPIKLKSAQKNKYGVMFVKVGLIKCMQTEDMCPCTTDFKVIRERKCAFEGVEEEIEVIGFTTFGG